MTIFRRRISVALVAMCLFKAQAADLSSIVAPDAKIEKIAQGFRFTEGPVWDPRGWLLFSDIPADTIYRWIPGPAARRGHMGLPASLVGSLRIYRQPSGKSNGLALDILGRLVACEHDGRISRAEADETPSTLDDSFGTKRLNSPNDLAIRSDGSIYFTDPPYGVSSTRKRELDFSGVYRIGANGKTSLLTKDMPFPNGLAFSPDETKLYVVDSGLNQIRVFDVKPDGSLGASRLFAEVNLAGSQEGPDGIKVDDRGNIFCAGPDGVWIFSPDGKLIGKILTPEVPSNLAFGGDDRSTLYITARSGVYRIDLQTSAHIIVPQH
jgi:gluconolactonase